MDQRVRYTKKVIRESFLEKIKRMPIDKITVRGICQDAGINRATFYKYYDNAYDLLEKLEDEVLSELEEKIKETGSTDFIDVFREVLLDVRDNYEIYQILFEQNDDEEFRKRLFTLCYEENIKTIENIFTNLDAKHQEWIYYFVAEGCNGLLNRWMRNQFAEDVEDVVGFAKMLVDSINAGA